MRCIVGLDRPTGGRCTIRGVEYGKLPSPLTQVGALLDGRAFHPNRTARQHLRVVADTHGFPRRRVEEVLELTGIASVANKRLKGFSLGMGQRLGIANALLGDPEVLLFDEPVNGLDPDGVRWVRDLMRDLAAQGRTILVSSHLMSEMSLTADDLVVIGRGRLPTRPFTSPAPTSERSPTPWPKPGCSRKSNPARRTIRTASSTSPPEIERRSATSFTQPGSSSTSSPNRIHPWRTSSWS